MAIEQIPLGQAPYGEDGADAREAFTTVNQNFAELDARSAQNAEDIAGKADSNDARFTDAREWTAATISQAEAEEGTAGNRRAWTAIRVRQAAAAWYASAERVLNRVLTGFVTTTNSAVTVDDTLIVAVGKLQAQLNGKLDSAGTAADSLALAGSLAAEFYRRANILGTVSQSSGVPTGAIIERGSNANGAYVRFADGTQICFTPAAGLTMTFSTSNYLGVQWNYPAAFVAGSAVPYLTPGAAVVTALKFNRAVPQGQAGSTNSATLRLFATGTDSFVAGETATVWGFSIGRWI